MRTGRSMAAAAALVIGGTMMLAGTVPAAAKKAETSEKAPNLSAPVRDAVIKAQKALETNDAATALPLLQAAKPSVKTDDDKFYLNQLLLKCAQINHDNALQNEAIAALVVNPRTSPADQGKMHLALAQSAYEAKNYPLAETELKAALALNVDEPNALPMLVEVQAGQNRVPEALQTLQGAIAKQKAAGQKPPTTWYGRGVALAYKAKLPDQTEALTLAWLADYPDKSNWRDSLTIYRELHKLPPDVDLDFQRLQRALGAMVGQGDYGEYLEAVFLRFPAEGRAVLDEGVKAGVVSTASGNFKEYNTSINQRLAADKASLPKSPAAAAKQTGKVALATGDAFMSYGDYTNAIAFYRAALTKPDADAGAINTHLALALAKSGQKDAAKQALAGVGGARAGLAKYMTIWIDQMA